MPDLILNPVVEDAVAEAMQLDLCFLSGPGQSRHVPFAFTPAPVDLPVYRQLVAVAPLLGRLTQALAQQPELIESLHAPLATGDAFFAELLSMHRELQGGELPRLPLLLQRSDFMVDPGLGPRLVECNSIAAGMAPFGERMHHLHRYLGQRFPAEFARYSEPGTGELLPNPAIDRMAEALVRAATRVRSGHCDGGEPLFLMVVQGREDNVFDQRLLERALRDRGVRTCRRSFRQLHAQLGSGPGQRLLLEGEGAVDLVYLRAGYQYQDYVATDLDSRRCCDALRSTRIFIERHRVAVNATVAQQLVTSKRTQQYLAQLPPADLAEFGFSAGECELLQAVFTAMEPVDEHTATRLRDAGDVANWVLKNQGEGGGHCLFDDAILRRLQTLGPGDYPAWTLMRRLRPAGRGVTTLAVREGRARQVDRLVSELGLFTAHLEDRPLVATDVGYLGYLVRSKPPELAEGGVHSGYGMLDSLVASGREPGASGR